MLKAILKNDINYPVTPVFVFNQETGNFEYEDSFYHFAIVMNDPSWQVYATNGELVYPIQNMDRVSEDRIFGLVHASDDEIPEEEEEEKEDEVVYLVVESVEHKEYGAFEAVPYWFEEREEAEKVLRYYPNENYHIQEYDKQEWQKIQLGK